MVLARGGGPGGGGRCFSGCLCTHRDVHLPAPQSEACRTSVPERDKVARHCSVQLPDGTSCVVAVQAGLSIKEVLAGLCERHSLNGAAVDLFLVGGDKVQGPRPGVCPGVGVPAGLSLSVLLARAAWALRSQGRVALT